ncbi:MAG: hypothetical protein WBD75_01390 [Phycisphaerae bacterium]
MKHAMIGIVVFAVCAWPCSARAEEAVIKEDLAACKLPHGELLLPDRNTPEAHTGYILRFSDGAVNPNPKVEGKQPESTRDILDLWRSRKTGDLIYSPLEGGCFGAVSGRLSDLGSGFLYEMSGRRFDRPPPVQSKKERSGSGEPTPGLLEGLEDGHCYLVETVDGKFALVRLVQKQGRYALIQYVYQPTGEPAFEIPKGETIKVQPPRPTPKPEDLIPPPPASVPGKVTDVPTLLEIRQKMIAELMAVVAKPATTQTEIMGKAAAVVALGRLRAAEAAPLLVQEIDLFGATEGGAVRTPTFERFFPCITALQEIGKPGSLAALAAVAQLRLDVLDAEEARKARFRLKLLVTVIRGVEGRDVAEFMIKAKSAEAPASSSAVFEAALEELGNAPSLPQPARSPAAPKASPPK